VLGREKKVAKKEVGEEGKKGGMERVILRIARVLQVGDGDEVLQVASALKVDDDGGVPHDLHLTVPPGASAARRGCLWRRSAEDARG
jgi:hypothetical protein